MQDGSKQFFFEKKEPKNFYSLRRAADPTRAPIVKSFCFFLQKEVLSCFLCACAQSARSPAS
jgi:hypothetical protein